MAENRATRGIAAGYAFDPRSIRARRRHLPRACEGRGVDAQSHGEAGVAEAGGVNGETWPP